MQLIMIYNMILNIEFCHLFPVSVSVPYTDYVMFKAEFVIIDMCVTGEGHVAICGLHRTDVYTTRGRREVSLVQQPGCESRCISRLGAVLLLADVNQNCLHVYSGSEGELLSTIKLDFKPWFISCAALKVWTYCQEDHNIYVLSLDHSYQCAGTQIVELEGNVRDIHKIEANSERLAFCCNKSHKVYVYIHVGKLIYTYGDEEFGEADSMLNTVQDLCLDDNNTLYIADYWNSRITIVNSHGDLDSYIHVDGFPCYLDILDNMLTVRCLRTLTITTFELTRAEANSECEK